MAAEAVLIIVSILLAFSIDAWWDERKERVEEQEILHGLQREFTRNRDLIAGSLETQQSVLHGLETLFLATESGAWESGGMPIDEAFRALMSPRTTDLAGGVREAMINAGRLDILSSQELRVMLIEWESVLGEMHDDEVIGRDYVFGTIVPYMTRKGVPLLRAFEGSKNLDESLVRTIADDVDLLSGLLSDAEFRSILDIKYGFKAHGTEEYEAAIAAADAILAEIDESLRPHSRQE